MSESRTDAWLRKWRVQTCSQGVHAAARKPRRCTRCIYFFSYNSFGGRCLDGHRKLKTNICLSQQEGGPPDSSSAHHQKPPQAMKVVRVEKPAASPGWHPVGGFLWFHLKCDQSGKRGHRRSCCSTACLFCPVSLLFFFFTLFCYQSLGATARQAMLITSDRDRGSNASGEWCCNRATTDWNAVGLGEIKGDESRMRRERKGEGSHEVQKQEVWFCFPIFYLR